MEAFVKYGNQAFQVSLKNIPMPEPRAREVLIKVAGCGVCGSDLHAYRAAKGYEWVNPPIVLGHEFTGKVVAVGSSVNKYQKGDRVVVIGIQGCGTCPACRSGDTNLCNSRKVIGLNMNGGMAEYAVVGEDYLVPVPETIDLKMAAIAEPLSVAAHALSKAAFYAGQNVVITGPGPIGLFCGVIAQHRGAKILIVGTNKDTQTRLPVAQRLGFTVVNANKDSIDQKARYVFGRSSPDLWIEASGSPQALKTAWKSVRRGGTLILVGMFEEELIWFPTLSVRAEHTFYFIYASAYRDYKIALDLIANGGIDFASMVNFFPLQRAQHAFQDAEKGKTVKIILLPKGGD